MKRKLLKSKGKKRPVGPKPTVKKPTLSGGGEMKMPFSKPVVVFGNGKLPDKSMLVVKMVGKKGSKKARSLAADNNDEEEPTMSYKVTEFSEAGMKV